MLIINIEHFLINRNLFILEYSFLETLIKQIILFFYNQLAENKQSN